MKLHNKIKFNGFRSLSKLQFDNAEAQPLIMVSSESEDNVKCQYFNQYFVAIIGQILAMSWGTSIAWSSPVIAKMSKDTNYSPLDFTPTPDEFSWIGSILPIGGFVGPIIFSPLPSRIGRKNTLIFTAFFFIASFLLLMFTNDLPSIYVARFLQGVGSGLAMVVLPMYIGEISSPDCRGILSSFIQIGLVLGILYAYCIGPFVDYFTFQIFCLVIPVIFVGVFIFMPDTPHFHIMKKRPSKALNSLSYLRSYSCDITPELEQIEKDVIETTTIQSNSSISMFVSLFQSRANIIALTIGLGLICLQNTTGIDAVLFYSETIFLKASSSIDSALATIIIGVVMLASSLITPFFVDSVGRKILLIISAIGMSASLTILGIYFFLDERGVATNLGWVPVTSLISFILFYCVGFGPLPFTVLSEMFCPEIKSIATSLAISACWIVDFIVTKCFLPLEAVIGNYGNFWLFGGFCLVALTFTIFFVFETKGLTLNEIQDKLNKRTRNQGN